MLQGVLLNVTDTEVRVLLNLSGRGNGLASKQLDKCRLASTVGANDGNTRGKGQLTGDLLERRLCTSLRLDTGQNTRRRELELNSGGGQGVVTLGLRADLNESVQVALVTSQLLVGLVVVDISGNVVQESGVVRNNKTGDIGVRLEIGLEPCDVGNIKMVSRTSSKAELSENLRDTLKALSSDLGVLCNEFKNADISILTLVVLNVACAENILRRETLELAVSNASHEGGLSSTVSATETIAVTLEESQVGVRQQKHATVSEGEVCVDNLNLTIILFLRDTVLALVLIDVVLLNSIGDLLRSLSILGHTLEVRGNSARDTVNETEVDIDSDHVRNVGTGQLVKIRLSSKATVGLDLLVKDLGDIFSRSTSDDILIVTHGLLHGSKGALGDLTNLGERGSVANTLDTGNQLGQESSGLNGVVDQLGQVLDNDNSLSENFLGSGGAVKRPLQERSQESQDRLQVVHAALNNGDKASKSGTHGLAEKILLNSLLLCASERDLGLISHSLHQLIGANGSLPLSGLFAEVLVESRKKTSNKGLGAKSAKDGVETILGSIANDSALIGECVESTADKTTILEEEDNLAGRLAGEEALKDSTDSSLLDLGDNTVVVQADDTDRSENDLAKAVAGIDRSG
ncbi:hypothetical protein HG530_002452 [Fusarium avenaceum]|nr:hypothetical protein HG530_002452 [Fusarium avenaceum]